MNPREKAAHALAVWEGTETHIDDEGFPVIGQIAKAELLADALFDLLHNA